MARNSETREVFGDYVSTYDFAVFDPTTGQPFPLYYENRIPELQLENDQFNDDARSASWRMLNSDEAAGEEAVSRRFSQ